MGGGLTRRMVVASGLLAVVIGAAFAVLGLSITQLRTAERAARHSEQVLAAANQLERLVIDLETGVRGFVLTGQERFLAPWQGARAALPGAAATLEGLTVAPAHHRHARQITQATTAYLRDYAVPLIARVGHDPAAARTVAATLEGKRRIDTIRARFDQLTAAERDLAAARQHRSQTAARRATAAAAGGLAGSVLLIVVFAGYLARAIVRPVRQAAAMAGRLAAGDLDTRIPQHGSGEIATLQHAFNTMASALQHHRDDLAASRARIVTAADDTRRRIERDLHDGIQQRLVALGLDLRGAQTGVPAELAALRADLARVADGLAGALDDLQELSRGIHPAILSQGGLGPALKALARRAAVPVDLDLDLHERLPAPVEVAAYYVTAEALTNTAKHARATVAHIHAHTRDGGLHLTVRDNGTGGADPTRGTGLVGLTDRVQALGGTITIHSPTSHGTTLHINLPLKANSD